MKSLNLILLRSLLLLAAPQQLFADGFHTLDYDTPSYLFFELTSYSVKEDSTSVAITVIRQGDFRRYARVEFATADVTASGGEDFHASGGTLTFAPGETRKVIEISLIADDLTEEIESFRVNLTNPDSYSMVMQESVTISIEDVPPAPEVPRIDITVARGGIQLGWENTGVDYQLERCTSACDQEWEPVVDQPEIIESRQIVFQSVSGPHYFYRLRAK
jgi:hypothetical protein